MTIANPLTIAVIGGTGPQGQGLAFRFARAGHDVVLGSRSAEKAAAAAEDLAARLEAHLLDHPGGPIGTLAGATNVDAAAKADVVVLAIPYDGHDELVASLRDATVGKVVISCVNPLGFDKAGPYGLDIERSAAESAAALLPEARVVGAFHHLSAVTLIAGVDLDEDVLVCGDAPDAIETVVELTRAVTGRRGVACGGLRYARRLEPLTAVLISVNRIHRAHSGVRITGLTQHGVDVHA
jgi:NADPH-dependent F420 reductase